MAAKYGKDNLTSRHRVNHSMPAGLRFHACRRCWWFATATTSTVAVSTAASTQNRPCGGIIRSIYNSTLKSTRYPSNTSTTDLKGDQLLLAKVGSVRHSPDGHAVCAPSHLIPHPALVRRSIGRLESEQNVRCSWCSL